MSKKKKISLVVLVTVILVVIGVTRYINEVKRQEESIKIQTQVAYHLYGHYRLYTKDKDKKDDLKEKYDKGSLTTDEYLEEAVKLRKYTDIKKIKFTNIYIDQMGMINLDFIINGVYEDSAFLPSINVDRNEWSYSFDILKDVNGYYLDEKERATSKPISKDQITFYKGRIK